VDVLHRQEPGAQWERGRVRVWIRVRVREVASG